MLKFMESLHNSTDTNSPPYLNFASIDLTTMENTWVKSWIHTEHVHIFFLIIIP